MNTPPVVRLAKPDDHGEIWRLFLQSHKENGLFTLAPEKVEWLLQRALFPHLIPLGDTGTRGIIGVIGPTGNLEGLAFLTVGTYWYSNDPHLEEFMVFVDQEHRGDGQAQALVQWMKDQVESTKLPLVTGILSTKRTEAKCRLYRRMLPKIGEFFMASPKGSTLMPGLVAVSS